MNVYVCVFPCMQESSSNPVASSPQSKNIDQEDTILQTVSLSLAASEVAYLQSSSLPLLCSFIQFWYNSASALAAAKMKCYKEQREERKKKLEDEF